MLNPTTIVPDLTIASYAILGVTLVALAWHYWHERKRR